MLADEKVRQVTIKIKIFFITMVSTENTA